MIEKKVSAGALFSILPFKRSCEALREFSMKYSTRSFEFILDAKLSYAFLLALESFFSA